MTQRVERWFKQNKQRTSSGEFQWSGRGLMPVVGYVKWERFERCVSDAMGSLASESTDVGDHFRLLWVAFPGQPGRPGKDWMLSLLGCCTVIAAADQRKPQLQEANDYALKALDRIEGDTTSLRRRLVANIEAFSAYRTLRSPQSRNQAYERFRYSDPTYRATKIAECKQRYRNDKTARELGIPSILYASLKVIHQFESTTSSQ